MASDSKGADSEGGAPPRGHAKLVLYAIHGSQFVIKIMAALEYRGVPYGIKLVDSTKLREQLKPPYTAPQLDVTEADGSNTLLTDSTDILEWLDRKYPDDGKPCFPGGKTGVAATMEELADTRIDACSRYFNWCSRDGFRASIEPKVWSYLPCPLRYICACACCPLHPWKLVAKKRAKNVAFYSKVLGEALMAGPDEDVRAALDADLARFEACFKTDAQQYIAHDFEGGAKPTGADFSLYGEMQRFCHTSGDANIGACLPDLLTAGETPRLKAWFDRMLAQFPIDMKSKRVPKEALNPAYGATEE